MKVIGLTGGIGSGKSTVLNILKEYYNAFIMSADDIGKETMVPGTQTYQKMVREYGTEILKEDGVIDTAKLSAILMSDEIKLKKQNAIVHPYVIGKIEQNIKQLRKGEEAAKADGKLVVVESAILFETGCDRLCDEVWVVTVPKELRIERLMRDRGYTRVRAESFINRQMSDEEYVSRADKVILNDRNMEELRNSIDHLL